MTKVKLAVLGVILILFSCKKDSNSPNKGVAAILTSGKWQITASTAIITSSGTSQNFDVFGSFPSCVKDNYYIFNSDGTGTTDEGATKCDPGDPQTFSSGNWQLVNNDTQLKGHDVTTGTEVTADIKQLDNSTMVLHYTIPGNGATSDITTTYAHIN